MTEIEQYTPRGEIAAFNTDPTGGRLVAWAQAASAAHSLATSLVRTSFVPKAFSGNPADATAAIILGDELGLSPLSALRSLYVIGGTPALYARTMTALVMSHGHQIWTVEETENRVTVAGRRRGTDHEERVTWTMDRARKAGYTSNKKYQTDPIAMLYARAAGDVARRIAPDVLAGVPYSVEEIELSEGPATTTVSRDPGEKRTVQRRAAASAPEPEEPPLDDMPAEAAEESEPEPVEEGPSPAQTRKMGALTKGMERDDRIEYTSLAIRRPVESWKDVTREEAGHVIDALERGVDLDGLRAEVGGMVPDDAA
jgi:hypothetical protein